MEEKKQIKEEELKKLKEFYTEIQDLKVQYGDVSLRIKDLEQTQKNLYEKFKAKGNAYKEYLEYLRSIYGDVNVDFNTGEISRQNQE